MGTRSDFLYAEPSFLEGLARILDFGNTLKQYNESPSSEMADAVALGTDWAVVGNELNNAMGTFEEN